MIHTAQRWRLRTHIDYKGDNKYDNGNLQLLVIPRQNHSLNLLAQDVDQVYTCVGALTLLQKGKATSGPTMSFSNNITAKYTAVWASQ